MGRPPKDLETIIQIARMRHGMGLSQSEIAARLGVSNATISRSLKQAFSLGILEIQLSAAGWRDRELEAQLSGAFNLSNAIVVQPRDTSRSTEADLARATALFVAELIVPGCVIGVSDGRSIAQVAAAMPRSRAGQLDVVSLIGGNGTAQLSTHSAEVTRVMAESVGGRAWPLPVPALVDSSEMARMLADAGTLRPAFDLMARVDLALIGIGDMSAEASIMRHGTISSGLLPDILALGAVGSVCGRFFDVKGTPIHSEIDQRTLSISLDALRRVPMRVAVATGLPKCQAISAALSGGLISVLGTDVPTAEALLRRSD